jgi:hypothetical protein
MSSKIEDLLDEYKKFKMKKDEGRMKTCNGINTTTYANATYE